MSSATTTSPRISWHHPHLAVWKENLDAANSIAKAREECVDKSRKEGKMPALLLVSLALVIIFACIYSYSLVDHEAALVAKQAAEAIKAAEALKLEKWKQAKEEAQRMVLEEEARLKAVETSEKEKVAARLRTEEEMREKASIKAAGEEKAEKLRLREKLLAARWWADRAGGILEWQFAVASIFVFFVLGGTRPPLHQVLICICLLLARPFVPEFYAGAHKLSDWAYSWQRGLGGK